jgi:hypothetical protein
MPASSTYPISIGTVISATIPPRSYILGIFSQPRHRSLIDSGDWASSLVRSWWQIAADRNPGRAAEEGRWM